MVVDVIINKGRNGEVGMVVSVLHAKLDVSNLPEQLVTASILVLLSP